MSRRACTNCDWVGESYQTDGPHKDCPICGYPTEPENSFDPNPDQEELPLEDDYD